MISTMHKVQEACVYQCEVKTEHHWREQNYLHETLELFDSLINSESFQSKPIILFLNKHDAFADKLADSPVSEHFTNYVGLGTDLKSVTTFFIEEFRQRNRTGKRQVYIYLINTSDTKSVELGMAYIKDDVYVEKIRTAPIW